MKVQIKTEYIKLDQLLKYMGVAENGSHAKEIILDEEVKVNGEVCTMRGKKLYKNDVISVFDEEFEIE
ncbi:MAG: RNA-binding S4 domain-containing protein [Clostridia bacterium]|nr:RNA-binding S4 domain-containing protein [Clostridia bacterium]